MVQTELCFVVMSPSIIHGLQCRGPMPRGGMASRWTHQIGIPLSDPCPYEGRKSISQYVILFINICIYIYIQIYKMLAIQNSESVVYVWFCDMRWLIFGFPGSPNLVRHETSKPTASEFSSSETSSPGNTPKASWQSQKSYKALVQWCWFQAL